eukprot:scaffold402491_cov31-Prasinocladus_malaysianus.AAC.2
MAMHLARKYLGDIRPGLLVWLVSGFGVSRDNRLGIMLVLLCIELGDIFGGLLLAGVFALLPLAKLHEADRDVVERLHAALGRLQDTSGSKYRRIYTVN